MKKSVLREQKMKMKERIIDLQYVVQAVFLSFDCFKQKRVHALLHYPPLVLFFYVLCDIVPSFKLVKWWSLLLCI